MAPDPAAPGAVPLAAPRHARNERIAERLGEAADLLSWQHANPFRVAAYRRAAASLASLDHDIAALYASGDRAAIEDALSVGAALSAAIAEMLRTGRWRFLDHLRGSVDPAQLFREIPGVGPVLAQRLHDELHVSTLQDLEAAVHDGRIEGVSGLGRRRIAVLRSTLSDMLGRVPRRELGAATEPTVALLLEIDREYREKATAGALPTLAPKRFNPSGESWLPVLHAERGGWSFTALYSNTARAHELGRIRDWVIIYFQGEDGRDGQRTVVTETRGALQGRRVVRGRERECHVFHGLSGPAAHDAPPDGRGVSGVTQPTEEAPLA